MQSEVEVSETEVVATTFQQLSLSRITLRALDRVGYITPSSIQAEFIPPAILGRDVIGQARTGTGKTAAFLVPMLEVLEEDVKGHEPQALVLVPTRELAAQVAVELEKLGHGSRLRSIVLCGGKAVKSQLDKLKRGVDIVIGTPGRVIDHLRRGSLDLSLLEMVVLDEADRMLDIGFRPDIERILKRCPTDRQTLLLSATVAPEVERLAQRYMNDPLKVNVSPAEISADTVDQYYVTVEQDRKYETLVKLIRREDPAQLIVFCRTKRGTDRIGTKLAKEFSDVACIHGDLTQRIRDRVMKQFRANELKILVATDVVGRGIDVTGISHIVNYDIPQTCDDYVHRVGRTGRMGRSGVAYTFVTRAEGKELTGIEMRINKELQRHHVDPPVEGDTTTGREAPPEGDNPRELVGAGVGEAPATPAKASPRGKKRRRWG